MSSEKKNVPDKIKINENLDNWSITAYQNGTDCTFYFDSCEEALEMAEEYFGIKRDSKKIKIKTITKPNYSTTKSKRKGSWGNPSHGSTIHGSGGWCKSNYKY